MIERNRATRRKIKAKKWESKLRKLWNSCWLSNKINEVKKNKKVYSELPVAKSWKDCKKDRSAVLYRNTRTVWSDKFLDTKEERKRNLRNRNLSKEDIEEINEMDF